MEKGREEMLVYKVTFLNNEVISCGVTDPQKHKTMREDVYYSQNNGLLIFALIKANSKEQALSKASRLAQDFPEHESSQRSAYSSTGHNDPYTTEHFTQASGPVSTPDYIDTTFTSKAPRDTMDRDSAADSRTGPNSPR
jgi:hypothetical protein